MGVVPSAPNRRFFHGSIFLGKPREDDLDGLVGDNRPCQPFPCSSAESDLLTVQAFSSLLGDYVGLKSWSVTLSSTRAKETPGWYRARSKIFVITTSATPKERSDTYGGEGFSS